MTRQTGMADGRGFTLIELMVVVSVIGLLATLLMPALMKAQDFTRESVCRSNLRNIGSGMVIYQSDNNWCVVPSYNMSGTVGGPTMPLDGWAPILDRDKVISGNRSNSGSVFTCPSMTNVEGVKDGQTGTKPENSRGWMDWPNIRNGNANIPTTIPERGFTRIIRVGYWINADNPIGDDKSFFQDMYYTCSVGYGGAAARGSFMQNTRSTSFSAPASLIALADGIYAGKHSCNRINVPNCRIGYRHRSSAKANVAYADGHVGIVDGTLFPRSTGKDGNNKNLTWTDVRDENSGVNTIFTSLTTASVLLK